MHRDGVMRLATARDEITTQSDQRGQAEPGLPHGAAAGADGHHARHVPAVDTFVIESLFASDLAFLQDLYRRINADGHTEVAVSCPHCGNDFAVDVAGDAPGGS